MDPQLVQILQQIDRFGFKFYGYNENNYPMVVAPNGQVVPVNVAKQFVDQQIEFERQQQQQNSSSGYGGVEGMPQMPEGPSVESNVEKGSEREVSIEQIKQPEQIKEPETSNQSGPNQSGSVLQTPTQVALPKVAMPYGDGYEPKSFNPADITQVVDFIERNSKAKKSNSNAWIAMQWQKFLEEMKAGKV